MLAFGEAREVGEDLVHLLSDSRAIATQPGAHLQVFQYRHAGKDAAAFRYHHQPFAQQRLRFASTYRFTVEKNLAAKGFQPGNGADGGAFARAVGADKRGLLALFHAE